MPFILIKNLLNPQYMCHISKTVWCTTIVTETPFVIRHTSTSSRLVLTLFLLHEAVLWSHASKKLRRFDSEISIIQLDLQCMNRKEYKIMTYIITVKLEAKYLVQRSTLYKLLQNNFHTSLISLPRNRMKF